MTSESPIDGNVLAGPLREIFAFETTAALATCAGCGGCVPMASFVVYASAPGFVARCGTCEQVQLRVVKDDVRGRTWIDLSGIATLETAD